MMTDRDIYVYAATVWGEARGEGLEGMRAVAHVIENRRDRDQWPDSIRDVCLQNKQFSVWLPSDPNFGRVVTQDLDDPTFWAAMYTVLGVALGQITDPTNGADHYHAVNILPAWTHDMVQTYEHKNHVFYDSRLKLTED